MFREILDPHHQVCWWFSLVAPNQTTSTPEDGDRVSFRIAGTTSPLEPAAPKNNH